MNTRQETEHPLDEDLKAKKRRRQKGFTLVELLVVVKLKLLRKNQNLM